MSQRVSPLVFSVADLEPGERRPESVDWTPDYQVELSRTQGQAHTDLELQRLSGGVRVHGIADVVFAHQCVRCLTEFTERVSVSFDEVFSDDPDVDYRLEGEAVDTEPLLRDEVTLSMPLRPLCRPDCAGLCPDCGFDLNACICPAHEEREDHPFAGLRKLFDS